MMDIDWHDFVVVQQIELYNDQEMNEQQLAQEQILAAEEEHKKAKMSAIMSEQVKQHMMENQELQNMPDPSMLGQMEQPDDNDEKDRSADKMNDRVDQTETKMAMLPEGQALDPEMKIVKNYVRKADNDSVVPESSKSLVGAQKCPNCQKVIPKQEWRDHFKICMMDSKWKEQKLQRQEREKMNTLASSDEITQNLRRFASQRPDIFGK